MLEPYPAANLFLLTESTMSSETNHDTDAWKYSKQAMNWYGWGSPVGLGFGFCLFIVPIGLFALLLHFAEVIR